MLLCWHKYIIVRDCPPIPWHFRWAMFLNVWLWHKTNSAVTSKQSNSVQKMFSWQCHTMLFPSIQNMLCYLEDEKYRPSLCVCLTVKSHFWFSQLITLHHSCSNLSLFGCLLHCHCNFMWGKNESEKVFVLNDIFAVLNRIRMAASACLCFVLFPL